MNSEERKAMRELHYRRDTWDGAYCHECFQDYPCDVIKVLDAWDQSTNGLVSPAQTNTGIPYVEGYQGRQGTQGAWEGTL